MQEENKTKNEEVTTDNPLKEMFVQYVGEKHTPEDGRVTVEMAVETMAEEFPEFLLLIAEENFLRGYNQAFLDIENYKQNKQENEQDS